MGVRMCVSRACVLQCVGVGGNTELFYRDIGLFCQTIGPLSQNKRVCAYVCVTCMCVCIHVSVHIVHVRVHVCPCTCVYVCVRVCTCVYVYVRVLERLDSHSIFS